MLTVKTRIFITLPLFFIGTLAHGMHLNEYLKSVKIQNLNYKASTEKAQGLELQLSEADLYYTPKFFIDAEYKNNERPPVPRFYQAMKTQVYSVGIAKDFKFGLETKLLYEMVGTEMVNPLSLGGSTSDDGFSIPPKLWDNSPRLEFKMPLWGGGFGRTLRASEESLRKQVIAEQHAGEAEALRVLAQAEAAYWKLSIWQEVVSIEKEALRAAKDILNHVTKKRRMNLNEDSDVVQAKALVKSKTLELKVAKDTYRMAQRTFNKFLNREATHSVDGLEKIEYKKLLQVEIPEKRPGTRADIKSLQAQADYAAANARLARERAKPTLNVYGSLALHGQDPRFRSSLDQSYTNEFQSSSIGVNLSVPLFFGKLSDLETGALKVQQAAELTKKAALYNQEQDWIQLRETFKDIQSNLDILIDLENTQKKKLEVERRQFRRGRTTVFQVLMFEQDYSQSSVERAKLAADILNLLSQIKLYQPDQRNLL